MLIVLTATRVLIAQTLHKVNNLWGRAFQHAACRLLLRSLTRSLSHRRSFTISNVSCFSSNFISHLECLNSPTRGHTSSTRPPDQQNKRKEPTPTRGRFPSSNSYSAAFVFTPLLPVQQPVLSTPILQPHALLPLILKHASLNELRRIVRLPLVTRRGDNRTLTMRVPQIRVPIQRSHCHSRILRLIHRATRNQHRTPRARRTRTRHATPTHKRVSTINHVNHKLTVPSSRQLLHETSKLTAQHILTTRTRLRGKLLKLVSNQPHITSLPFTQRQHSTLQSNHGDLPQSQRTHVQRNTSHILKLCNKLTQRHLRRTPSLTHNNIRHRLTSLQRHTQTKIRHSQTRTTLPHNIALFQQPARRNVLILSMVPRHDSLSRHLTRQALNALHVGFKKFLLLPFTYPRHSSASTLPPLSVGDSSTTLLSRVL
nr:MAG TPA: hypothetical protein [Siphoviridae sp. ctcOR4]